MRKVKRRDQSIPKGAGRRKYVEVRDSRLEHGQLRNARLFVVEGTEETRIVLQRTSGEATT